MTSVNPPTSSLTDAPIEGGVPAPRPQDAGLDRQLLLVASVVVLGAIMSILDVTVVSVAIPTLAADFATSLATIQWIATGYTLALATVIPLSAWGAERFGTKRLYVLSVVAFLLGSALAGMAWNAGSLIFFRVLQGFGGGLLMPVGMTILTRAAGPQRVGRVMAVMGVPMLLGPICGPILGGWLVDDFSWRWIFFINVPIGVLALVLALRVLPRDVAGEPQRLDWLGLALLSPGLAALIYGLAESGNNGGFGSPEVVVPAVAGALVLAAFVWHASRAAEPLIDLRLFRNKVFSASTGMLFLVTLAVFGGMLLLPLYLQQVRGESAMDSGLLLAPQGIGAMIAMPIAGRLTDSTGIGKIVPVGLGLIGLSFLGLTQLEGDTSYWVFGGLLFVLGLGLGATLMPTMSGAMQTLRRANIPSASTSLNIIQQVGTSIGTAVFTVLLIRALQDRLGPAAGGGEAGGGAIPEAVRAQVAPLMAEAFGSTFWWAIGFAVVAFCVAVALLPKRKPEPFEDDEEGAGAGAAPVVLH